LIVLFHLSELLQFSYLVVQTILVIQTILVTRTILVTLMNNQLNHISLKNRPSVIWTWRD